MSTYIDNLLRQLFDHEAIIIIIKGFWKTGKTNVGLRILEELIRLGIIKLGATNIKVTQDALEKYDWLSFIQDMPTLKDWHYDDPNNPIPKAFVLDEAGKIAVKRRAMGRVNVSWMEFIPELSKGRLKLIVITQAEYLTDSMFTETEFTRGIIEAFHNNEYGYSISVESELIDDHFVYLNKFPKTNIDYPAYSPAEWSLERTTEKEDKEFTCCKIAKMYAKGKSTTKIANEMGFKSRESVTRLIKRHIRHSTIGQLNTEDIQELAFEMGMVYKNEEKEEIKI